jgi:predicted membrane protein
MSALQFSSRELTRTERLVFAGLLLILATVIAQATAQAVDYGVYGLRIGALDSNLHDSVFGIASLLAQAGAVGTALAYARRESRRTAWLLLAALVAVLLVLRIGVSYSAAPLVPPTAAVFALYWWLTGDTARLARRLVIAGLVLLAFSFLVHAVGATVVTGLGYDARSWAWQVKGILKHCTELAGWALLATGTAAGVSGAEPGLSAPGRA